MSLLKLLFYGCMLNEQYMPILKLILGTVAGYLSVIAKVAVLWVCPVAGHLSVDP